MSMKTNMTRQDGEAWSKGSQEGAPSPASDRAALSWQGSPLAVSVGWVARLMPMVSVHLGEPVSSDETDWFALERLAEPELGDRVIARVAERTEAPFALGAVYSFRYALYTVLRIAGYLFAAEGRVPVLRGNVLIADRDWLNHIALLEPRAVVLEGDSLTGLPGIRAVTDEAALEDALFEETAALVEPLLAGFAPRKLVARATGWGAALDTLAYGFQLAGRGDLGLDAAWERWERTIAVREFGFRRRPRRFQYEVDGEQDELLVRSGCCLYFTSERAKQAERRYCTSCYIETDERRLEILTEYKRRLAREGQGDGGLN
jgi:hypothetical protein